jgi:hypothetical protein
VRHEFFMPLGGPQGRVALNARYTARRLLDADFFLLRDSPGGKRRYLQMIQRRRRLPHLYPDSASLFVTWSLHGVLPPSFSARPGKLAGGQAFVWMDRHLDSARAGPMYLRQPAIAQLVVESIRKGEQLDHYELYAFVIMANHVHVLIHPHVDPSRLLKSLKGATAREANKLLGRTGEPFWQKESYDH